MRPSPKLIFFLLAFALTSRASGQEADWFKQGQAALQQGDPVKAADIWQQGYTALLSEERIDSRIGFAYIELVTQEKMIERYFTAHKMYFWALEGADRPENEKEIRAEMERLLPLVEQDEQKEWRRISKTDIVQLARRIKTFWQESDPTPSTERNDRLLEHWERIAYARKTFRKARDTIYGTDARGLIYVRLGEPERKIQKTLGTVRADIKRWTHVWGSFNFYQPAAEQAIVEAIDRLNRNPDIELWFYHTYAPEQEPVFYMFGRREGRGHFGLIRGVDELIPKRAFMTASTRSTRGLLPGAVLQTIYYEQISNFHPYFADKARKLNELWNRFESLGTRGLNNDSFRSNRDLNAILARERTDETEIITDGDRTTFGRELTPVTLTLQPVRRLQKNTPALTIIALTVPKIGKEYLQRGHSRHRVTHTLLIKSAEGELIEKRTESLPPIFDNVSVFTIDHKAAEEQRFEFITEVFGLGQAPEDADESYIPENQEVIGYARTEFTSDEPLSTTPDSLELSDLVIGVSTPEDIGSTRLDFPVVPALKFRRADQLYTWLEVYHLFLDESGTASFTIDFQIYRISKFFKKRKEMIASSFSFTSNSTTAAEYFGIDIKNLRPGTYELVTRVQDNHSEDRVKERTARFEILKDKDESE